MIIEHSGDFKVVDPKTKEVRYDSVGSSYYWDNVHLTVGNTRTIGNSSIYWKKDLSKKDQILELLKGETFENIKDILEDVFEEVKYKAKY